MHWLHSQSQVELRYFPAKARPSSEYKRYTAEQPLYQPQSLTQRLLRLLLVFWKVVFFGLEAIPNIVAFFVIVVIYDPKKIFFKAFKLCFVRCYIIPISKGIRAGVFIFAFFLLKPLFRFFLSLFENFRITGRIICGLEVLGLWLRLVILEFFMAVL